MDTFRFITIIILSGLGGMILERTIIMIKHKQKLIRLSKKAKDSRARLDLKIAEIRLGRK